MKHLFRLLCLCLLTGLVFASCEKPSVSEEGGDESEVVNGDIQVRFRVAQIEQIPFGDSAEGTRTTPIGELCQRISYAIYQNGERKIVKNQVYGDEGFGEMTLSLAAGTYQVVIVAHNGAENAQTTDLTKITFKEDNKLKVTDTFYYYDTLEVSENCEVNIQLKRAVAMVRFVTKDTIPAGVKRMRFYYTGGSSTFNATSGLGVVDSKQTEFREVTEEMIGKQGTFYFYTFPRDTDGKLNIRVTAYGANDNSIKEKEFNDVPITQNQITQYKGYFFTEGTDDDETNPSGDQSDLNGNVTLKLTVENAEWDLKELTF